MSKRPASAAALPAGQQRLRLDFFNGEKKKQATSAGTARGQPYRGDGGSAYTACPVCGVKVPLSLINHHLDSPGQCGGPLPADTGAARAAAAVRAGTPGAAAAGAAAASVAGPAADIASVSASRAAAARLEAGAPSVCPIGMAVGTKSRCLDSSAVGHSAPRERPRPTEAEAAAAAAAAAPAVAGPAPATLAAADFCSVYHYDYNNDDNGSKGAVEGITEIVTSQEEGDVMLVEEVSAEGTAVAEAVRAAAAQAAAAQAAAATVAAAQPGRPGGTERMSDVGGARRATTVPDVAVEAGPLASAPGAARAACGGPPESKTGEKVHAAARGTAGAWQPAPHQAPPKDQGQGQGPAAGSGRRTSPLALAQPPTPPQPTNQPPAPPQPPVHAFFQARRQRPPSGSRNGGGGGGGGGGAAGGLGLGADEDPEPRNGVEEEDAGGEAAAGGALCGRQRVPPPLPAGDAPPTMRMVPHPRLQGQALVLDFVSAEEEEALLGLCDTPHPAQPPWLPPAWPRLDQGLQGLHGAQGAGAWGGAHALATVQRSRNKRWGVQPDYHRRGVAPAAHPLPPLLLALARRMRAAVGGPLKDFSPNEANAIDYRRSHGSWLKPHADDRILSGEVIVNLSLAGDCVMTLARLAPQSGSGGGGGGGGGAGAGAAGGGGADEFRIRLPRRSLQIMCKAARYSYSHGIWPADLLDERRVSITFRHSKPRPFAK